MDMRITRKIEERNSLRDKATHVGVNPDPDHVDVKSSPNLHRTEDIIVSYVDLEKEIDRLVDEYVKIKDRIINEIHQMDDPRYEAVLYLRYVKFYTFEVIADDMKYSLRRIYQLHGEALQAFARLHLISS